MEKLRNLLILVGIGIVKVQYFIVGFAISLVFGLLFLAIHGIAWAAFAALASSSVAGLAKELIYDKLMGKGTPDIRDALFTGMGGAMSIVLIGFIDLLV